MLAQGLLQHVFCLLVADAFKILCSLDTLQEKPLCLLEIRINRNATMRLRLVYIPANQWIFAPPASQCKIVICPYLEFESRLAFETFAISLFCIFVVTDQEICVGKVKKEELSVLEGEVVCFTLGQ